MAPTRVIVHAGFHKTGTTSLQTYLAANRAALAPHFDFHGPRDMKSAGGLAATYAQRPFPWRRWRFRRAFARFLSGLPAAGVIVLSNESFCGVMPGHRDWRGRTIQDFRTAAIPLCRDVIAGLRKRFGADVEITFLFTTRGREAWLHSAHGHLLRSIHLTESFDEFRALFAEANELEGEAQQIAAALAPVPVLSQPLEKLADRHEGPAAAILDLLSVPQTLRDGLPPARRKNRRQDSETEAEMIRLNRSGLGKRQLKSKKDEMLRARRR